MRSSNVCEQVVLPCAIIIAARALERPRPAVSPLMHQEPELAVEALSTGCAGVSQGALVPSQAIVEPAPEPEAFPACWAGVMPLA